MGGGYESYVAFFSHHISVSFSAVRSAFYVLCLCCSARVRVGTSSSDRRSIVPAGSPFSSPLVLSPLRVLVMSTGSFASADAAARATAESQAAADFAAAAGLWACWVAPGRASPCAFFGPRRRGRSD